MRLNDIDYMLLWKNWNNNPNHPIFTKLQNNFEQSYRFARYLIMNNKEVPERFLQSIAKDSNWSYDFSVYLIDNNKQVPKIDFYDLRAKKHFYFPDFYIPKLNLIVEIRSDWTMKHDWKWKFKEEAVKSKYKLALIVNNNFSEFDNMIKSFTLN